MAENRKRLKRGAVFIFAFWILNFSFKSNLMVIYFNVLYMHLAPASKGLRNSPSTTGPITEFSAPVFQAGSSQLFLYQSSLHPLSSSASCPLPATTAAFLTYLAGPNSTTFPLFLPSLPLTKSYQGSTELSLIMMCQGMSLGSVPCLTSVVAIPHPSEMLHFWNNDFDWHHPVVFLFMSISRLRSVPKSTTPVSISGKVNVRMEHFPFY